MKITIQLILLSIILFFASCSKNENKHFISIDFQNGFNNNKAKIYIDNKLVYNDIITTSELIGFADSYNDTLEEKTYNIKIVIDDTYKTNFKVHLESEKFIGISYNPSEHSFHKIEQSVYFGYD